MSLETVEYVASVSGGVLYVIAALGLIALTVMVERSWALAWAGRMGGALCAQLSASPDLDRSTLEALERQYAGSVYGALLRVATKAVGAQPDGRLSSDLEEALMLQVPRVDRGLWLLDTAVTLGPLLGLLGTIIGIFSAFKVLGNPGTVPSQVTAGVAEALIATAAGLVLAIIGLIWFNGLQKRVRLVVHRMETVKLMLESRLTRAVPGAQGGAVAMRSGTDRGAF